jgi:hypothetical protein
MVLSGMSTIPNVSLANGNKSANGGGAIWNGGTSLSIGTWDLLSMFNLIVKFFQELWNIYQRVQTKKNEVCKVPHKSH